MFKEPMKIFIASDHTGIEVRSAIIEHLENDYQIIDLGPNNDQKDVNYALYGIECAQQVVKFKALGFVICGSGIGISIAANKVEGARCALVYNEEVACLARKHNNANLLAFGARQFDIETILKMIDSFLATEYEGERHQKRIDAITQYECK